MQTLSITFPPVSQESLYFSIAEKQKVQFLFKARPALRGMETIAIGKANILPYQSF